MRRVVQKWKNALIWLILFCVLASVAMAAYTLYYEKDRYRSFYTLLATPIYEGAHVEPLQAARMLSRDMEALTQTTSFRMLTMSNDANENNTIAVYGVDGTHLIKVEVVSENASSAQALANASGDALITLVKSKMLATDISEIARAELPQLPFAPKRLQKVLLTFIISLVIGLLFIALFGRARRPLHAHEFSHSECTMTLLGAIADERKDLKKYFRKGKKSRDFGMLYQYVNRFVRENVCAAVLGLRVAERCAGAHTVLLTSVSDDDGKPMFVALLACELARQGFRTLLIDLEGGGELNQLLAARGHADLIDYLIGDVTLQEVVMHTALPHLSFIDYRHESASEVACIAATGGFLTFLHSASENYDFVLLNASALSNGSAAAMLGTVTGATVLIAADGRYSAKELNEISSNLSALVNRLCGLVLTRVPHRYMQTPLSVSNINA